MRLSINWGVERGQRTTDAATAIAATNRLIFGPGGRRITTLVAACLSAPALSRCVPIRRGGGSGQQLESGIASFHDGRLIPDLLSLAMLHAAQKLIRALTEFVLLLMAATVPGAARGDAGPSPRGGDATEHHFYLSDKGLHHRPRARFLEKGTRSKQAIRAQRPRLSAPGAKSRAAVT